MKVLVASLLFLALGCAAKPAPAPSAANACAVKPVERPAASSDSEYDGMPIILSEGIKCLVWRVEGQSRVAFIYRRGEYRTVRKLIPMDPDVLALLIRLEKAFVAANPEAKSRKLWTICNSVEAEKDAI